MGESQDEIRVDVLGPLRVETAEGPTAVAGAKQRLLLAFLCAAGGRPVATDVLVDGLWPDAPPRDPEHALQNLVSRLRRVLGGGPPTVRHRGDGYELAGDLVALDSERFEELLQAATEAHREGREDVAFGALVEAEKLWRGRPFADVPDGTALAAEIARLERMRRSAHDLRFETALSTGRHEEVLEELLARVSEDPLDERRRAQLMVALTRSGRQAEALAAYREGVELLRDELGVDPGPELEDVHLAILRRSPELVGTRRHPGTHAAPRSMPSPLVAPALQPLVGRGGQLSHLAELWREACSRYGRLVLLEGEAGAGKTRLLAALAADCLPSGATVLFGRCEEGLGVPYQPFVEALGGLPEHVPDAGDGGSRHALFETVTRWLEDRSADGPLLVLVDDLHWATTPTLLLLRHLARWGAQLPMLVVAAVRERGEDQDGRAGALLAELRADPSVHRVAVPPLDPDAVYELVAERGGDRALAGLVHERTTGNPFLVQELLREIDEDPTSAVGSATAGVPARVAALVASRRARLSPPAEQLLDIAAVMGELFDVTVAGDAADLDEGALADAVDELVGADFLAVRDPVSGRYGFVHALVRDAVLEPLNPVRRRRLHRAVASALEPAGRDAPDEVAGQLARHLVSAEEWPSALRYSVLAGELAARRYAWEDAAEHYRRALVASERGGEQARRGELLLALADVERRAANSAVALELYREGFGVSREHGSSVGMARAALGFEATRAEETFEDHATESGHMLMAALDALGPDDAPLEIELLAALVVALVWSEGISPRVIELSRRALEGARAAGDPALLAASLEAACWTNWTAAGLDERLRLTEELGRAVGHLDDHRILRARVLRAAACLEAADRDGFEAATAGYGSDAHRLSEPWYSFWVGAIDGGRALLDGRFDDLQRTIAELSTSVTGRQQAELVGLLRTVLATERGDRAMVQRAIEAWTAFLQAGGGTDDRAHAGIAFLAAAVGDHTKARRHLGSSSPATMAVTPQGMSGLACLGLAAAELGHQETIASVRSHLAPYPERVVLLGAFVPFTTTSLVLARLAAAAGDTATAIEHVEEASRCHQRLGAPAWLARSRYHHAELLAAPGPHQDLPAAAELADAAAGDARRLEMDALHTAAHDLRERCRRR